MKKNAGIVFFLYFIAISILVSLYTGLFYRSTLLIILVSAALAFLASQKWSTELETPKLVIAMGALAALLSAVPFLFIHPFVDASADPAAHISTLAIGDRIPATYEPFSGLAYTYQIGFPLFARLFVDMLWFADSGTVIWALGLLMNFLQVVLVYHAAKKFSGSENAGIFSSALLVAGKLLYQNMFWGQYTWMLGSVLLLACFIMILHKSPGKYIFFPAIIVAHPGSALEAGLIFIIYMLAFEGIVPALKLFAYALLALPSYFISYKSLLSFAGSSSGDAAIITLADIAAKFAIVPPWIGVVPFLAGIFGMAFFAYRKNSEKKALFLSVIFAAGILLNVFFSFFYSVIAGRIIEVGQFGAVFLGGMFISKIGAIGSRKIALAAVVLILLGGVFFYATSSQLSTLRGGTKISGAEATFAEGFRGFDPSLKTSFIIAASRSKIAEVSNKIPYDIKSNFYLSYDPKVTGNDPYNGEIERRSLEYNHIVSQKCASCLRGIGVDYIVIDTKYAGFSLPEAPIYSYGSFEVYAGK